MTKLVVIIGFAVAFAAGLIIGIESRGAGAGSTAGSNPSTTGPSTQPVRRGGWLNSELNLSADQQERLNKIWSEMARNGRREQEDRRRELRTERDEAITALLGAARKPQYEAIQAHYADQLKALDRESRAAFQKAVEDTKQVLTAEQRTKYEELLSRHQMDRGERGGPRGGEGARGGLGHGAPSGAPMDREHLRGSDGGATSIPATTP